MRTRGVLYPIWQRRFGLVPALCRLAHHLQHAADGTNANILFEQAVGNGSVQVLVQLADYGASQRFLQRSTASIQWLRLRAAQQAPATSTGVELLRCTWS